METYYAGSRAEWGEWLEKNYKKEKEILLIYYKKDSGKASISYDESVEEALCFGWIDGVRKRVDDERYSVRFTPRKPGSIWSVINKNRIEKLINEGKVKEEALKTIEEAKSSGNWEKAYSMKGKTEIPPDLKEALMKNKLALENFNKLSNSNQFTYIFQIDKIKTKELRAERIKKVVELLEKNIKPYVNGKPSIMHF